MEPEALTRATEIVQEAQNRPTVRIADVQKALTEKLGDIGVEFLHTDCFDKLNGRLATVEELTAMIATLKKDSQIPFGYITDGCYARAHMMDESFRQHGINFAKMFVRGDLAASNSHMEAHWWYHVAPLTFVDDGQGNPVAKIIDPGFSDKPLDPDEWVKAMNQGPSIQVDLVDAEQYYPRRTGKPKTFSENLKPAVSKMKDYSRALHRHRTRAGEDLGDFVEPSWKNPGSGGTFSFNGETRSLFPEGIKAESSGIFGIQSYGGILLGPTPQEEPEVSATWENRPKDFDPYNLA